MVLVFNDKLNLFGILEPGWEYVAVQLPIYVSRLGQRAVDCTYIEQVLLMDSDWEIVSEL